LIELAGAGPSRCVLTSVEIMFKISARAAKKTHFTITKISRLKLFKEVFAVCSASHTKPTIYSVTD